VSKKKSKSRTKTKTTSKIRANARTIVIVVVLISIFSGLSFYLGMATPRSFVKPIDLYAPLAQTLDDITIVAYGPAHTGVKVTFEVTTTSQNFELYITDINGAPIGGLSGSGTGVYATTWHFSPGGCIVAIHMGSIMPTSMDLEGTLTITSSRFPFI
jgi:hypothetical protein